MGIVSDIQRERLNERTSLNMDDAIVRASEESNSENRAEMTRLDSSYCSKHSKPKVHRNKPMRGWFCNDCNNEKRRNWYQRDPRSVMLQSAKTRAKRGGLKFDLTKDDIVIPDVCPVLGISLKVGTRYDHDSAPTLDKKIPELGYIRNNIAVVSYRANRIRNDASLDELRKVIAYAENL